MTNKLFLEKDSWGTAEVEHMDTFGSCCGSRYIAAYKARANFYRTARRIRLAIGEHATPGDNGKQEIHIVQTQNGPLTVSSRYVW